MGNNCISKPNPYNVGAITPISQTILYFSITIPSLRFTTTVNISATEAGLAPAFFTVCCLLKNIIFQEVSRNFLKNWIPRAKKVSENLHTISHFAAALQIQRTN